MKSADDPAVERANEASPSDSHEISVLCETARAFHMARMRMKHTRRTGSLDVVGGSKLAETRRTQKRGKQSREVTWESPW